MSHGASVASAVFPWLSLVAVYMLGCMGVPHVLRLVFMLDPPGMDRRAWVVGSFLAYTVMFGAGVWWLGLPGFVG